MHIAHRIQLEVYVCLSKRYSLCKSGGHDMINNAMWECYYSDEYLCKTDIFFLNSNKLKIIDQIGGQVCVNLNLDIFNLIATMRITIYVLLEIW